MKARTIQLTFGEKIKQLREAAGYTPAEAATLLKKSLGSYLKLEIDFLNPSESMLRKVANLYSISCNELLAIEK